MLDLIHLVLSCPHRGTASNYIINTPVEVHLSELKPSHIYNNICHLTITNIGHSYSCWVGHVDPLHNKHLAGLKAKTGLIAITICLDRTMFTQYYSQYIITFIYGWIYSIIYNFFPILFIVAKYTAYLLNAPVWLENSLSKAAWERFNTISKHLDQLERKNP